MFSYIYGADVFGMEARIIRVEADVNDGLPVFDMVGYLASAVKEARERVRIAIRNAGVFFPAKRITINLSPANLRKEGASFDLPIAVALLSSFAVIPYDEHKKYLIIGELGLDGKIHGVNGILAMILEGMQQGITNFIIPKENEQECSIVDCDNIYVASDIDEVIKHFREDKTLKKVESQYDKFVLQGETKDDFIDVIGQSALKRAAEIAVSGRHNLLILGPPGTGKTMLARRIPTIMPKLTKEEQLELTKIYSISGKLTENMPIIVNRPFRAPHHSSTPISLTGGGRIPTPGEITLASKGV